MNYFRILHIVFLVSAHSIIASQTADIETKGILSKEVSAVTNISLTLIDADPKVSDTESLNQKKAKNIPLDQADETSKTVEKKDGGTLSPGQTCALIGAIGFME